MIGAYISEDFYFFFNELDTNGLRNYPCFFKGKFVYEKGGEYFRMELMVRVDYKKEQYLSTVNLDIEKKVCEVVFITTDFYDWFINPNRQILEQGPNWRYLDSNVYLKNNQMKGAEDFRNNLIGYLEKTSG